MAYRPPKGVRPPQLEGRRTGRPKGSRKLAGAWRDAVWGYQHRWEDYDSPPSAAAVVWRYMALNYPWEVAVFLGEYGQLGSGWEDMLPEPRAID